ncbi:MAG: SHOCT domain-containing protein [Mycobacteriaceae bacterium]|nr:SHOCT domain-containing protein [Mycobacteriaceae bacterium]
MFCYDHDVSGWGHPGMGVGMLLFWCVLIAGLVLLARCLMPSGRTGGSAGATPRQVLDERFARGEIDEQEYRNRLETLGMGEPR